MARLGRSQTFKPLTPRPDLGPVYFDNVSSSGYEASLSTYNWTHVIGTNSNRGLIVSVGIFAAGTVSGIDVSGQAMTFVRSDTNGIYRSEIWRLVAPASGSVTITVTLSASLTSIAGAVSWWNVDQTNFIDANAGANGTNDPASASITPNVNNVRIYGNLAAQTASGLRDQIGQALKFRSEGALGTDAGAEKGIILTPASTTLQWNGLGALDSWAVSLVSIKKFTAAATNIKTFNGLAYASTKTINGLATASMKTRNGLA